ncbi:F-box/kelch-repeat protein At3g24760 [Rutidosis leptorrhynchoides]|uniref:F-box/kelch-repeat protein At3g24760 n=1 Tax=Rutidosis leptorrhynchoides TaxID=125765 RepID=UPI003A9A44E5
MSLTTISSYQMDQQQQDSINFFNILSSDLTQLILSHLPIRSIIRCSAVCKQWHSITTDPSFPTTAITATTTPWFFIYGRNNIFTKNNQAFAFDPISNEWIKLPNNHFPPSISQESSLIGSGGFFFNTNANHFSFSTILKPFWGETEPLKYSRLNPLIGVVDHGCCSNLQVNLPKIIVVGGVRFIGGLIDIEDHLAVEIYNQISNSWDLCPPLPADFRSGNSSQSLSSTLFGSKFYVFGIHSCFVTFFDLENRVWSRVQTLRPPGVIISFLISCSGQLMLAGLCNDSCGPSFCLWRIDEMTMEFSEVAIMPHELLNYLFDSDEDDRFATLKCVGFGNFIFVFNEENRRNYPACVCEISSSLTSSKCSWRKVPNLPEPVNRFHKVIGFCSTITLHHILHKVTTYK